MKPSPGPLRAHCAVLPPSVGMTCPVMNRASSEPRKATAGEPRGRSGPRRMPAPRMCRPRGARTPTGGQLRPLDDPALPSSPGGRIAGWKRVVQGVVHRIGICPGLIRSPARGGPGIFRLPRALLVQPGPLGALPLGTGHGSPISQRVHPHPDGSALTPTAVQQRRSHGTRTRFGSCTNRASGPPRLPSVYAPTGAMACTTPPSARRRMDRCVDFKAT